MTTEQLSPRFGYRTDAADVVKDQNLNGKYALVTGGYSGVGLETVRALAGAGATVTIAGRNAALGAETAETLNADNDARTVNFMQLDLANQADVRRFAAEYSEANHPLHMLINNAAVMACPFNHTSDGFEMQFGTNHLGHFTLINQLLDSLKAANGARVICLSSTGHFRSPVVFDDVNFEHREYDPWSSYGQSKTANSLTAVWVQQNFSSDGIEGFGVHPGGIMTNLQRHMADEDIRRRGWVDEQGNVNELFKTVQQGASTSVWAATAPELSDRGGQYLADCAEVEIHTTMPEQLVGVMDYAVDPDNAEQLAALSTTLLG